jgi:copper(I)-binding protein
LIPLLLLVGLNGCHRDSVSLEVGDAWVRPILPVQSVTAAYFDLRNLGRDTVRVTAASSPAFEVVEMHEMATDGEGVMRMRRLASITIAPGETVQLKPGGKHLMLIGPKHKMSVGNDVSILLETGTGDVVSLAARVDRRL